MNIDTVEVLRIYPMRGHRLGVVTAMFTGIGPTQTAGIEERR